MRSGTGFAGWHGGICHLDPPRGFRPGVRDHDRPLGPGSGSAAGGCDDPGRHGLGGAVTALRIGVVGAGQISGAYLSTLRRLSDVEVVAVCDLDEARARTAAAAAPGVRPLAVAELLTAADVDLVLNLTIPAAHAEVAHAPIAAGKHVYGEKPLAVTTGQAREVLAAAVRAGVRVGCAPGSGLRAGAEIDVAGGHARDRRPGARQRGAVDADVTSSCDRRPAVAFGSGPDDPSAALGPRLS
jgi:Oxidoreductase family, NAD-binding Rossmann fold